MNFFQSTPLVLLFFSILDIAITPSAAAQDSIRYTLPQITVESSRLSLSEFDMNQSVTVIQQKMLEATSPQSLEDALRLFSTLEIRRRGAEGVQTDIGIRGTTFSQQLLLLNGMKINDPQTAHHNFDLPVTLHSVKQIEIVRGPNSARFGADAFGGVINIVTSHSTPPLSLEISGGQFGAFGASGTFGTHNRTLQSLTSVTYSRSDGFRYDTEFDILTLSSSASMNVPWGTVQFFAGYTKKDFGAFDFYSPGSNIPSHEQTQTVYSSLGSEFTFGEWKFSGSTSFRHHYDHFIFDIRNPLLSDNEHNTNVGTLLLTAQRIFSSTFFLSSSAEASLDHINSTKLGIHSRSLTSLSTIGRWIPEKNISVDGGVRVDVHSQFGATIHPIFTLGYLLTASTKIFSSFGTSFRAPSYTDLYYGDPKTVGNTALKPERGSSVEFGIHTNPLSALSLQTSAFMRTQNNLIDYVQYTAGGKYFAANFSEAEVRGVEVQTFYTPQTSGNAFSLSQIFFGYTYIDSRLDIKNAIRTRYSFTHPKHQVNGSTTLALPYEFSASLSGTFRDGNTANAVSTFDVALRKKFGQTEIIFTASNLFNTSYEEIPGIPLPGRWVIGKMRWSLE